MNVTPRTIAFPADGGSALVNVVPTGTCSWAATTPAGWLTLSRGGNAVGVQTGPNDGAARTALIDIGGHIITVTQAAKEVIISPPLGNLIANGGFNANTNDWLTIYSTGTGNAVWVPDHGGSARITSTQALRGYQLHTCVNVTPNTRYEVGTDYMIPSGQDSAGLMTFGVYEITVPDCTTTAYVARYEEPPTRTPVDTWTSINRTYTTGSQARSLIVVIGTGGARTPPFRTFFDNVYVREKR